MTNTLTPEQRRIMASFDMDELRTIADEHLSAGMSEDDAVAAALVDKITARVAILGEMLVLLGRDHNGYGPQVRDRIVPADALYARLIAGPLEAVGVAE